MTLRHGLVLLLLFCLLPLAHAGEPTPEERTERERLHALLGADGQAEEVRMVTPLETTRLMLEHNLSIKESELDKLTAQQALREAEALFDPRFSASASYAKTQTFTREEEDYKYFKNTVTNGATSPVYVLYEDTSPISYLRFNRERVAGYYLRTIQASEAEPWGGEDSTFYSVGLGSDLPWGMDLDLSMNLREKKNYWLCEDGSWGSYGRPWKSSFNETLILPLPFSKDFGPHSSLDTQIDLAETARDSADWAAKVAANDALLQGELAYWELVARLQNLLALDRHAQNLETLLVRTRRLYDERLCTAYDLALVQSAATRAGDSLQQGIAAYRAASNQLSELTDAGSEALFFPKGYTALADLPLGPIPGEQTPEDVSENPAYGLQQNAVALARIEEKYRNNQARPDLAARQSLTLTQGYSNFGYADPGRSMGEVFTDPDMIRQDYSLRFTYPLFNRAARSSREQAALTLAEERTRARQVQNSLRRTAADALTLLQGARRRVSITAKGLELARAAFKKAMDLQSGREVTEYEILSKSSNQLTAQLAHIAARIDCHKAAARFQAARGAYQKRYAARDGGQS